MPNSPMEHQAALWTRSTREAPPQATMEELTHHIAYLRNLEAGIRKRASLLHKLYLAEQTSANELSTQRLRLERLFVPVTKAPTRAHQPKPKARTLAELISGLGLTQEQALAMLQDLAERGE
jgi:hypothetical protein